MMTKKRRPKKNFEIRFYENLVEKNPHFVEALSCLAAAYTKKGFYREGLSIDKKLTLYKPKDPVVFYNLACSYALIDEVPKAIDSLKKALTLGYNDFQHMFEDPDLENLRQQPAFTRLIEDLAERIVKS